MHPSSRSHTGSSSPSTAPHGRWPARRAAALFLAVLAWSAALLAVPGPAAAPGDPREGDVRIPPDQIMAASPFLLKQTRVRSQVSGPVAQVTVTQEWANPNTVPVDGLYIFPLPHDAAVNGMSLRIGERLIHGEMKRREEARAIYERARSEGRVAGLLDQERPNVFAQQVANIMPGASLEVILTFDHPVACEDGRCEYVFPTVVGPRFIPASMPDPGRIDPPVIAEGSATGQSLELSVTVDAGATLGRIDSPSHRISITRRGSDRAVVDLDGHGGSALDRDFRLRYTVGSDRPEIGVLAWRDPEVTGGPGHFTLVIQPPAGDDGTEAAPRELVFVLDCSGSMRGVPLEASRKVVRKALRAVRPGDTFRIIRFSERASGLGGEPLAATPANVSRALRYLDSLQGSGGTMMIEGIRAALDRPADPDRLRIVAFLTDGYIGNEGQILAEVRRLIGSARLFSFGIGSSVNRHLLEGLAEEGRGMAAFLEPRETADEMVDRFVARIDRPVLTDIRIHWEDLEVADLEPSRVPDLFAGRAVLVHGRYTRPGTGVVVVEGRRSGRWESYRRVAVLHEHEEDHEALGRLWARARIHRLEREMHGRQDAAVEARITELGLRHRLMTPWTSLVAVDSLVTNHDGGSVSVTVPVEMARDVSREGVFGAAKVQGRGAALQAPARAGDSLRALGYTGAAPPPVPVTAPRPGRAEAEVREKKASGEDAAAGLRVDLFRADGSRIVVEADGEVWLIRGRSRSLRRTLTTRELEDLTRALEGAGVGAWGDRVLGGARLVARGGWGRASIALDTGDPAVEAILRRLEVWAG